MPDRVARTLRRTRIKTPDELTDAQLAERLVALHGHRNTGILYGQYVIARGLKPAVDAKTFGRLLAAAVPNLHHEVTESVFDPTHVDTMLRDLAVRIEQCDGYYTLLWEDGHSGSDPGIIDTRRYRPILT